MRTHKRTPSLLHYSGTSFLFSFVCIVVVVFAVAAVVFLVVVVVAISYSHSYTDITQMISRWELTGRQLSSQVDVIRVCVSVRLFPRVLCAGNTLSDSNVILTTFLSNAFRDDHQSTEAFATHTFAQSRWCFTPAKGNRRWMFSWTDRPIRVVIALCLLTSSLPFSLALTVPSYNPICSSNLWR